jgi:hypothetical protein
LFFEVFPSFFHVYVCGYNQTKIQSHLCPTRLYNNNSYSTYFTEFREQVIWNGSLYAHRLKYQWHQNFLLLAGMGNIH